MVIRPRRRLGTELPVVIYLRAWRKDAGLTQEQLGDMINTDKNTISRWEAWCDGERDPRLSREPNVGGLQAAAEALGLKNAAELFYPPTASSIMAAIESIPDERRPQALEILGTFRGSDKRGR
jgi:transcriptional regulator with XRE-family HTH domain